jgi:hypothetical protein
MFAGIGGVQNSVEKSGQMRYGFYTGGRAELRWGCGIYFEMETSKTTPPSFLLACLPLGALS